jgi:hypothetical protein
MPNCNDVTGLQKQSLERISELVHVREDCSEKIQLLKTAINYGKKISSDVYHIHGIETIIKKFNELEKTWRTKRVCELAESTFWGILLPFLSPAAALQPLVKSLSFMTVAKEGLKEFKDSTTDEDKDANEETAVNDFNSLMKFLTTKAIVKLQAQWNPV